MAPEPGLGPDGETVDHIFEAFEGKPLKFLHNRSKYLVSTLTDHIPATSPEFVGQVVDEFTRAVDFSRCQMLVGEEDRGGYITAVTAYVTGKRFSLVKWNPTGLIGEAAVEFSSAYAQGTMFLNGVAKGDNVVIVEDFIDTGGTLIALIKLVRKIGANVIDTIAVVEKIDHGAHERIERETGVDAKWLIRISVAGEVSKVVDRRS